MGFTSLWTMWTPVIIIYLNSYLKNSITAAFRRGLHLKAIRRLVSIDTVGLHCFTAHYIVFLFLLNTRVFVRFCLGSDALTLSYSTFNKHRLKSYIAFSSFRWKVNSLSNTKFWKLNNFSRFLLCLLVLEKCK